MWRKAAARCLITTTILVCVPAPALASSDTAPIPQSNSGPPNSAEAEFNTRPLVRARLRIPDSLQGFTVIAIAPLVDDASRFEVTVIFRAKTPFGGVTQHSAQFQMRRATSPGIWITTAK